MIETDTTLCLGCRAIEGKPWVASDLHPGGTVPKGLTWETFNCERCGVEDARLGRKGAVTDGDL